MDSDNIIYRTQSLCPVCLKKIDADIFLQDGSFYMEKTCPDHGTFKTIVWKGSIPMNNWIRKKERAYIKDPLTATKKGCPYDCGLCGEHRQHTCTALIEITQNCNLHCRFCFADSGSCKAKGPSLEQIKAMYQSVLKASGICNIQLSGGEPTIRDDLPAIVRMGKKLGFSFIQVNTNGLRMAEDENFVKELKLAGLNSIFLQFDGTKDTIYQKLRGRGLLTVKIKAIENCEKYGIGVVLVPTLVPKVNVDNIGGIINFALEHIRAVRGVHFQPVSYFGRMPHPPKDEERITLAELMDEIEKQTGGKIKAASLKPPKCENSLCSFHGNYIYRKNGELMATAGSSSCSCKTENAEAGAIKAKKYVAQNWSGRKADSEENSASNKSLGWDEILHDIYNNSFSLSAMAFQDVWNVDLERVRDCCIHEVSPDGKLIPFCIYNITDTKGRSLYRPYIDFSKH